MQKIYNEDISKESIKISARYLIHILFCEHNAKWEIYSKTQLKLRTFDKDKAKKSRKNRFTCVFISQIKI